MTQPYVAPELRLRAFNCLHCFAYSNIRWSQLHVYFAAYYSDVKGLTCGICVHCEKFTVWRGSTLIYPDSSSAPMANPDLPNDVSLDYGEARSIFGRSPRGAAALLRLCIQKLCKHLGESGKDLNSDIAALVKKGLSAKIQKSLDIVRVIGNESVHPGQIDLRDTPETAGKLFQLINIIADAMITQPSTIDEVYSQLPASKLEQIDQRDKKPNGS